MRVVLSYGCKYKYEIATVRSPGVLSPIVVTPGRKERSPSMDGERAPAERNEVLVEF